jgi:pantothenate synthetase
MGAPIFNDAKGMREFSRKARRYGKRVALVPTMVNSLLNVPIYIRIRRIRSWVQKCMLVLQGFLHQGHLSLVESAL